MIDDLLFTVATMFVLLVATFERPSRLHAPRGFYFEGVRPTGETTMRPSPRDEHDEPRGAIGARIFCTGGSTPILVSSRVVGCQHTQHTYEAP